MEPTPMEEAVSASLYGPYRSRLKIGEHHFDIRQADARRVGSVLHVSGHISHNIRFDFDDEILYNLQIEPNKIISIEQKVNDRGWGQLVGPVFEIIGKFKDIPITRQDAERLAGEFSRFLHGDWLPACGSIIACVAAAFALKEANGGLEREPIYYIEVKTADRRDAGTDANVYITLFGKGGLRSESRILDNSQDNFERNKLDKFDLRLENVDEVDYLVIGHDNTGDRPGWFLESVSVARNDPRSPRMFHVNGRPDGRWLATDEEDKQTYVGLFETVRPLAIRGPIAVKWSELGAEQSFLGQPLTDEMAAPDGVGRFNQFQGGGIYWTPDTSAHEVHGAIRNKWAELGWERGFLGYPLIDETATPDAVGRYNHFQGGSIYWHPDASAHEVHGAIRDKWAELGWERGFLGYPLIDETATPDGVGRFNHFQGGSIYWHPDTGAHEVHGAIRDKWEELGWERSALGYPTTDERPMPDGVGRFSDFQGGSIHWHPDTGAEVVPR